MTVVVDCGKGNHTWHIPLYEKEDRVERCQNCPAIRAPRKPRKPRASTSQRPGAAVAVSDLPPKVRRQIERKE